MKKNKTLIILVIAIAVVAVGLFVGAVSVYKRAQDVKKQVIQEAIENETGGNDAGDNSEDDIENWDWDGEDQEGSEESEGEAETEMSENLAETVAGVTFTEVNDQVSVLRDGTGLSLQPTADADQPYEVPLGRLLNRNGVSETWSRVEYNGLVLYILNENIEQVEGSDETAATTGGSDTAPSDNNGKIVIIDPGHQGQGDSTQEAIGPGASSTKARVTSGTSGVVSGLDEYELNLIVSLQLRDELESRGYTVYMTRETHDINISNRERAEFATEHNGDILVRIHANGSESSSVSGALTMAPTDSNPFLAADLIAKSRSLSQYIIDAYVAATGFNNQGVYQTDEMSGINWSTMPVTIVEMGYMSNPGDDAAMADSAMQVKIVAGISDGIDQYFAAGN